MFTLFCYKKQKEKELCRNSKNYISYKNSIYSNKSLQFKVKIFKNI